MKSVRYIALVILVTLLLPSCEKNSVSKVPFISLIAFAPDTAMIVNIDTCYFYFNIVDGDADIAGPDDTVSEIYLKDSRDSSGFQKNPFPNIDVSIEDPKKDLEAKCLFFPFPWPVPRSDSLHAHTGDTLYYELYIKDRAGHESNHIITHTFYIRP